MMAAEAQTPPSRYKSAGGEVALQSAAHLFVVGLQAISHCDSVFKHSGNASFQ